MAAWELAVPAKTLRCAHKISLSAKVGARPPASAFVVVGERKKIPKKSQTGGRRET